VTKFEAIAKAHEGMQVAALAATTAREWRVVDQRD
jgi:hypothetical protein